MKPFRSFPASCLLLPVFSLLSCADPNAGKPYDIVITNARIVDGTGNPWYYGDVGIRGDRIATIAPRNALSAEPANERIDAGGMVLSPGFIDIQSHSWNACCSPTAASSAKSRKASPPKSSERTSLPDRRT